MTHVSPSPLTRWITCPQPNPGARLRLFCLPHAGGGASAFHFWGRELPDFIEVRCVQPPGRESRLGEPPYTRLTPLVEALAVAIDPFLDLPYALFGHSNGALVGFELARTLRRARRPGPVLLSVAGCAAPHLPDEEPPLHLLPDADFVGAWRALNGTPDVIFDDPELLALLLPTVRADLEANETYQYVEGPPLDCPIAVFGGASDPSVTVDALEAWCIHTRHGCTVRLLPGGHFFLQHQRRALLAHIAAYLLTIA